MYQKTSFLVRHCTPRQTKRKNAETQQKIRTKFTRKTNNNKKNTHERHILKINATFAKSASKTADRHIGAFALSRGTKPGKFRTAKQIKEYGALRLFMLIHGGRNLSSPVCIITGVGVLYSVQSFFAGFFQVPVFDERQPYILAPFFVPTPEVAYHFI